MSTATATETTPTTTTYASFGRRLVAVILDWIIIGIVQSVIITPLLAMMGLGIATGIESTGGEFDEAAAVGLMASIMAMAGTAMMISYAVSIFYFAIMESSSLQASVGKLALSIKVTDLDGQRISFGKGLLRSIGKIISGFILFIGYLMAAFTEKKQGLHDMIASTLVLKK